MSFTETWIVTHVPACQDCDYAWPETTFLLPASQNIAFALAQPRFDYFERLTVGKLTNITGVISPEGTQVCLEEEDRCSCDPQSLLLLFYMIIDLVKYSFPLFPLLAMCVQSDPRVTNTTFEVAEGLRQNSASAVMMSVVNTYDMRSSKHAVRSCSHARSCDNGRLAHSPT